MSGYVARRMAASLSSVGVPAHFVHGSEWVHGDFGSIVSGDCVVAISHSGNTKELCDLEPFVKERGATFSALVGSASCGLGALADPVVVVPAAREILGLVPSRSIVAQEACVNAILSEIVHRRGFHVSDFGRNHPGGSIGRVTKDSDPR